MVHLFLINLENLQPLYKESTLQSSHLKIQRNKESCCSLSSSPSMSSWSSTCSSLHQVTNTKKKLKGVRRRKWGKWVSEIRVPGTQERLWLGTYATAEAAAVAHDVAVYCLRKPSSLSLEKLNFPQTLSSYGVQNRNDMSPKSIQKVASDVGMDVDARNIAGQTSTVVVEQTKNEKKNGDGDIFWWEKMGDDSEGSEDGCRKGEGLSISVEDYL